MKLGRLKEWRESSGLTQRELASKAGIGHMSVVRAETGVSVRPGTARKLADALGREVPDLLEHPPTPAEFVVGSEPAGKGQAPPSSAEPTDEERRENEEPSIGRMRRTIWVESLPREAPREKQPERRLPTSAEIVEEHRALFGVCATVLDEINGTFGPYLEGLSSNPTPEQWQAESRLIEEALSVIEAIVNRMSKEGVLQKLEPYIDNIVAGHSIGTSLEKEVRRLRYSYAALFSRTIPLAKKKWRTRLEDTELDKLDTLDSSLNEGRAALKELEERDSGHVLEQIAAEHGT